MTAATAKAVQDAVEPVVLAHVTEAIAKALEASHPGLVEEITTALNVTVDEQGRPSSYSNSMPWIRWAVREAVYKATRTALDGALGAQNEALCIALQEALAKSNLVPVLKGAE